jgi:hypothetical protein
VTTERVNLVNAGALAKARGITLVERKTRDAGAYATQLTLSSDGTPGGRAVTVGGTVAAGEARITASAVPARHGPTDVMLITRHTDKPGWSGASGRCSARPT